MDNLSYEQSAQCDMQLLPPRESVVTREAKAEEECRPSRAWLLAGTKRSQGFPWAVKDGKNPKGKAWQWAVTAMGGHGGDTGKWGNVGMSPSLGGQREDAEAGGWHTERENSTVKRRG